MPIVHVEFFEGRSVETKRALVQDITDAVTRACKVSADGVHVLLEEKSRDNWGRGAVLRSDRAGSQGESDLVAGVDSADIVLVAEMASPSDTVELPPSGTVRGVRRAVNAESEAGPAAILFAVCRSGHEESADWLDLLRQLHAMEAKVLRCRRADLPLGGLDGQDRLGLHVTLSTHRVREDRVDEYLQLMRLAVHPEMNRFGGFVSSDRLRQLPSPSSFFVVNQWLSREHADAYTTSSQHDMLKARVRELIHDRDPIGSFDVVADRLRSR